MTASWNTDNKSDRAARLSSDINDSLRQQQQQQPGSVEEGDWTAGVLRPPHSRQPTESNSGAFTSVCLLVFLVDTWSVPHYWISKYKHDCNRQLIIMHVFLSNIWRLLSVGNTRQKFGGSFWKRKKETPLKLCFEAQGVSRVNRGSDPPQTSLYSAHCVCLIRVKSWAN